MLKIKNNVDLKELEKYGFYESGIGYAKIIKQFKDNMDCEYTEYIVVERQTRRIFSDLNCPRREKYWTMKIYKLEHIPKEITDLVEKVD